MNRRSVLKFFAGLPFLAWMSKPALNISRPMEQWLAYEVQIVFQPDGFVLYW